MALRRALAPTLAALVGCSSGGMEGTLLGQCSLPDMSPWDLEMLVEYPEGGTVVGGTGDWVVYYQTLTADGADFTDPIRFSGGISYCRSGTCAIDCDGVDVPCSAPGGYEAGYADGLVGTVTGATLAFRGTYDPPTWSGDCTYFDGVYSTVGTFSVDREPVGLP